MEKTTLSEKVMELIGEASMCWNPIPTGVFASDRAIEIGKKLLKLIKS